DDAGIGEMPVGEREAVLDLFRPEIGHGFDETHPVRPDGTVRADELVGDPRQRPVMGDQSLGTIGGGTAPAVCLLARHGDPGPGTGEAWGFEPSLRSPLRAAILIMLRSPEGASRSTQSGGAIVRLP